MSACLPIAELEAFLAGGEAPAPVRAHLERCTSCAARLAELRDEHTFLADVKKHVSSRLPNSPAAAAEPPAGAVVEVPGYEIRRVIGRGGQAVVYEASQQSTRRRVALKVLLTGGALTARRLDRFQREIRLVARLRHPGIVTVYDSGTTTDERPFLAMEYIDGRPVNAAVDPQHAAPDPRAFPRQTLQLFARICDAVRHAQQRGVIHRDLKPSNILVDGDGQPHVLDFGLAKIDGLDGSRHLTLTGEFVGTLAYAAPEQVRGDPHLADTRTDVYALGTVLFELLTGRLPLPLGGSFGQIVRTITEREPDRPSAIRREVDNELETIVLKALAKDPDRRYENAAALLDDVQRYLAGEPISAKRDSAWYVLRKTLRRHRAPLAVVTGFVALAVTFGLTMGALYGLSERHRAAAEDAAERLGAELAFSSMERGRLLSRGEQAPVAEALIWTTWLEWAGATRAPERASADAIERQAYWALWGLYHRHPALSTLSIGAVQQVTFSDRAVIAVQTDYEDGLYRPVVRLHGLAADAVAGPVEVWRFDRLARWRTSAMSLDGQALAYANDDYTIVLDARTREVLADMPGEGTWAVALSSPSRGDVRLARIPLDRRGVVEVSNLSRGAPLITLAAAGDPDAGQGVVLWHADISADGRVITAAERHAVHVWDASDEGTTPCATVRFKTEDGLTSRQGVLSGLALHPDGSVLATLFGSALDLWSTRDGRHVARLPAVSSWATDCRFSPDGRRIASFGGDRLIQVWDVESRMLAGVFSGHLDRIKSLALSPDGSVLVTADTSGMAKVWDLARPRGVENKIVPELSDHSVRFSADGTFLATCGVTGDPTVRPRGSIHVWRLETGERIDLPCGHDTVSDVEFLPDASRLAASSHDGVVRVWSLADQQERMRIEVCPGVTGKDVGASSVCLSPDGALIAAAGNDGAVHLWNAADGRRVATLQHGDPDAAEFHARRLPQARFDPSGRLLASVCADHSVVLWDVASKRGRRLAGHEGTVRCAAFNPDGRLLATGGDDRRVLLWDAVAAAPRGRMGEHSSSVFALSFSPDGLVLAAGGADGSATLWDVATGRQLLALDDCAAMIMALDFSRDGSKLAASSSTEGVVIWNLRYYDRHIAGNLAAQRRANQGR